MHWIVPTTFKFQKLPYADCHARARGSEKLMRAVANIDAMKLNVSSAAIGDGRASHPERHCRPSRVVRDRPLLGRMDRCTLGLGTSATNPFARNPPLLPGNFIVYSARLSACAAAATMACSRAGKPRRPGCKLRGP